jgi:hypothetical protein
LPSNHRQSANVRIKPTKYLTKVEGKWIASEEPDKAIQFSDTILQRRPRKTPFVATLEFERGLGSICRALFDIVRFVKLRRGLHLGQSKKE